MTATASGAKRTAKRTNTAQVTKKGPLTGEKEGASKGAAPAKKAAPRAATGRRRAVESPGAAIKRQLSTDRDSVGVTVLIRQAARVADRLENIDRVLSGDAAVWMKVGLPRSDEKRGRVMVEVRVDDLVREERSQTTVLRSLLAEIHRQRSGLPGDPSRPDEDDDLNVD